MVDSATAKRGGIGGPTATLVLTRRSSEAPALSPQPFEFADALPVDVSVAGGVYCMAGSLSTTLFSHFGETYDPCVLIHDMDES